MRQLPLLFATALCALLLATLPAAAAPRTHVVVMDNMKFGPVPQNVRKGDLIVWDNRDMFRHTATANKRFDVDVTAGAKARMRVTASGTFPFVCKYHPGMKGVLRVAE